MTLGLKMIVELITTTIYSTNNAAATNRTLFSMHFDFNQTKGKNIRDTLEDVYKALEEKGYSPINQIVGYLLSCDPAYIPRHNDARNLILKHERDEIIEELVKSYLGKDK